MWKIELTPRNNVNAAQTGQNFFKIYQKLPNFVKFRK